jgi:nitroreductase
MDALEAIRKRRSVRSYTDTAIDDADLDEILRLALLAPTGGMSQAWSLIVVRDPEKRQAFGDLVVKGGGEYFRTVRPAPEGATPEEHAEQSVAYAKQVLGTYDDVPAWIAALIVPRGAFPEDQSSFERDTDMMSIAFAMENLMVAARAKGLATVPTIFHYYVIDELRELLQVPKEIEIPIVSPLGYPTEWPEGLPPRLKQIRRPWRTLVHDDSWDNPRA